MKRWLLLVLLIAGPACAEPESLLRLYRDARANHPDYLAARAEAVAEAEREPIARGRLLPNIAFSGSYGQSDSKRTTPGVGDERFEYDNYSYSLILRQPLFRLQDFAEYRKARVLGRSSEDIQGRAENELVLGMVATFLELLLLDDRLHLQAAQQTAAMGQLAAARRSFELGSGTRIDIDEIQARVDLLAAQTYEMEHQRAFRQRELEGYAGRPLGELPEFVADEFTPLRFLPSGPVEAWVSAALAANHDYRLLAAQVEATQHDVMVARSGHYPTLDLVASASRNSNDSLSSLTSSGDVRYETTHLGLQVNVPLFAGGQVSAQLRQAQARAIQARHRLEGFRARLEREVRHEYETVKQGWEKIRALELAERSAQQSVRAVGKGISAGVRSTTDRLLAEQQHIAAQVELTRGRYQLVTALLKLKSMSGVIHDNDLQYLDACFRKPIKSH